MWTTSFYNTPTSIKSIELLLLDDKKNTIQATIFKPFIDKWREVFLEGQCYRLETFVLEPNEGDYKAADNNYKIIFNRRTTAKSVEGPQINLHAFKFISFQDILQHPKPQAFLVDVIGVLKTYSPATNHSKNGIPNKRRGIVLTDDSEIELHCTLWGDYANQFDNFLNTFDGGITIMLFQLARINIYEGNKFITNSFNATKMYFNPDIPEANKLKNSSSSNVNSLTPTLSQKTSRNSTIKEEVNSGMRKSTLHDIKNTTQCGYYLMLATIENIETCNNWYYDSCHKCAKKVETLGAQFKCNTCNTILDKTTPRYKIQVSVSDHTGIGSLVIFDQEATLFFGKTAVQLTQQLLQEGNPKSFPDELDKLVNKRFIFKVEVSQYNLDFGNQSYAVRKMADNINLIQKFQNNQNISESWQEGGISQIKSAEKGVAAQSDHGSHCLESHQDKSSSSAAESTPAKSKSIIEEFDDTSLDDLLTPQLSTSRPKKHIKIEKTD